jgi:ketosteroid isomerase-like protein
VTVDVELAERFRGLYDEWFAALPTRDAPVFERLISDDWVYTDIFGRVRGKQDYLRLLELIPADAPPNRMRELAARRFGDLAIVHGHYEVETVLLDGTDASSSTRFTAVWVDRGGGRWQSLAHHATSIRPH